MNKWTFCLLTMSAGALMAAFAVIPTVQAQWTYYGSGSSFFVPFANSESPESYNPRFISLTLNNGNTATKTTNFLMDTGSLGIVSGSSNYSPNTNPNMDAYLGQGVQGYSTSGAGATGAMWLTTLTINGANGQTATTRVPVLLSDSTTSIGTAMMGVGYDRNGVTLQNGGALPNLNPFLGLLTVNGQSASGMAPGYVISSTGFTVNGQTTGPGVMLGLNQQNTNGFAAVQLTSTGAGLPYNCTTAGMGCPLSWNSQTATVSVGSTNLGNMPMLPDSGIGFMYLQFPNAGLPTVSGFCGAQSGTNPISCLPGGTQVQVFLPGQPNPVATYTTTAVTPSASLPGTESSNPVQPSYGVQIEQGADKTPFINTGRAFLNGYDYYYDPINGFVGYRSNGLGGASTLLVPMAALQGPLSLPNQFSETIPVWLAASTTLQQSGSGTFFGSIGGPGGLTLQSGGVTLAAANTYTGGTIVNGGVLTVASMGSISGNLTVNSGGSFVNAGTAGAGGALTINAGANFTNSGTFTTPGVWQLNQGSFTNTGTFSGHLANTGTASNTGTFDGSLLNGAAGTFANNGTVTGTIVNNGLITGNGTISGDFTNNGTISPGNSIGTITIAGNYSQTSPSAHIVEVVGSGQGDRIIVGGVATLGGTVSIATLPGAAFGPSTTYTLITAAGGLNGTFAGVNELYPFLQSSLSYDANNVYLTLQVGGFAAQALNPTQAAVGAVLDQSAATATGDFATVLGTLATATAQQGQAVMTSLSGNNYAGFSSSMVQGAQLFMTNFSSQTGGGGSPGNTRVAIAEACEVACDSIGQARWGAWGGALGGLGTIGANQAVGGVTYNVGGFAAGLDRAVTDNLRVGVTAGYTSGTQWVSGFDGRGTSNTLQAGLYAGFARDRFYADAIAGYAYSDNQMWRTIAIPGLQPRTAQGRTGANQWYGQIETGYRFDMGTSASAFLTPFVRLQGYTGTQAGFTETGAQSLSLTVAQQTTNSLRSVLGAQLGGSFDMGWRDRLALQFRLGWSHEYADTARPVTASFAGAPSAPFTTYGVAPQRDGAVLGLAANTAVAEATSIFLRYEGDISGQDSAHALTAGFRMTW